MTGEALPAEHNGDIWSREATKHGAILTGKIQRFLLGVSIRPLPRAVIARSQSADWGRGNPSPPSPLSCHCEARRSKFPPQRGRIPTCGQRATFPALLSAQLTGEGERSPIDRPSRSGRPLPHHPLRGTVRFAPLLPAKPATGSFCFGKSPRWGKHRL